jgi:antitoxin (DNA-binding transcriptional repressor) of toxin-antitoxin stability system
MQAIGVLEAKTKFDEICDGVAARGVAVLVTRRGKPFVRIEPARPERAKRKSVWDIRAKYEKAHGRLREDFPLPRRSKPSWGNPLDE